MPQGGLWRTSKTGPLTLDQSFPGSGAYPPSLMAWGTEQFGPLRPRQGTRPQGGGAGDHTGNGASGGGGASSLPWTPWRRSWLKGTPQVRS